MDELKSILVVASRAPSDYSLLKKALCLARGCGARIDLFYYDAHAAAAMSDAILSKVAELQPDLVMKAPAGSHPLRLLTLDLNDWRLARGCPTALMLVTGHAWPNVPRFGALIDVREDSIAHLAAAVLHSCEYLTLGCGGIVEAAYCEPSHDRDEVADRAAALERLMHEFHIPADRVFALRGDPDSQLPEFVARQCYNVLALGAPSHRKGPVELAGGLSSKLIDAVESDLLLVRLPARPRPRAERHISERATPESSPTTHRP